MSIRYTSNLSSVVRVHIANLEAFEADKVLRNVVEAVLPEMRHRVHVEGKASDGSQIGTYSNAYMKIRTGNFQNSGKISRGKNKGALKNAGTTTKGTNQGAARQQFNRTSDPKVVLSLTRQMENDLSILPVGQGYGIGFKNPENYQKSQWNEDTYKKDIWKLTEGERELAVKVANEETSKYIKK